MKLVQFFSYFGAKKKNAKYYPEPTHDLVIEPFAGSAGYSHLHFEKNIVLFDTYEPVVSAWEYLISATKDDILGLPLLKPGQSLDELTLSSGEKNFIGFWLARASSTPRTKMSSWQGNWPNRFWGEYIRAKIADQVHLINHWKVHKMDYRDAPDVAATWFIDPPYQEAGTFYPEHDMDFVHLGSWCQERKGQVIVCEAEGADWLPFTKLYDHVGIQRKKRTEVWWYKD